MVDDRQRGVLTSRHAVRRDIHDADGVERYRVPVVQCPYQHDERLRQLGQRSEILPMFVLVRPGHNNNSDRPPEPAAARRLAPNE